MVHWGHALNNMLEITINDGQETIHTQIHQPPSAMQTNRTTDKTAHNMHFLQNCYSLCRFFVPFIRQTFGAPDSSASSFLVCFCCCCYFFLSSFFCSTWCCTLGNGVMLKSSLLFHFASIWCDKCLQASARFFSLSHRSYIGNGGGGVRGRVGAASTIVLLCFPLNTNIDWEKALTFTQPIWFQFFLLLLRHFFIVPSAFFDDWPAVPFFPSSSSSTSDYWSVLMCMRLLSIFKSLFSRCLVMRFSNHDVHVFNIHTTLYVNV